MRDGNSKPGCNNIIAQPSLDKVGDFNFNLIKPKTAHPAIKRLSQNSGKPRYILPIRRLNGSRTEPINSLKPIPRAGNNDPRPKTTPKLDSKPKIIFYLPNLIIVTVRFFGDEHEEIPLGRYDSKFSNRWYSIKRVKNSLQVFCQFCFRPHFFD